MTTKTNTFHSLPTLDFKDAICDAVDRNQAVTISTRVMNSTDHFVINGFWNKDAKRLKHIMQGYMIALHQGIDVSELTTERLIRKLDELGNDPTVVK